MEDFESIDTKVEGRIVRVRTSLENDDGTGGQNEDGSFAGDDGSLADDGSVVTANAVYPDHGGASVVGESSITPDDDDNQSIG